MATTQQGAVVVGVDGTRKDARAVTWAADEAARRGTSLQVLYAFSLYGGYSAQAFINPVEFGARITGPLAELARTRHPTLEITTAEVFAEDPAAALIEASHGVSMVVLGARGLGRIAGRLLGSVSQKVAAFAHAPVVVVRDTAAMADGPVVVGVDPADASPDVLAFAFEQAARSGVSLRMVHALVPPEVNVEDERLRRAFADAAERRSSELRRVVEHWSARHPEVPVSAHEVHRHPIEALTEEAGAASVLVVGSRGRRGLTGMRLGSVAQGVLHEAPVVAVIRVAEAPELITG